MYILSACRPFLISLLITFIAVVGFISPTSNAAEPPNSNICSNNVKPAPPDMDKTFGKCGIFQHRNNLSDDYYITTLDNGNIVVSGPFENKASIFRKDGKYLLSLNDPNIDKLSIAETLIQGRGDNQKIVVVADKIFMGDPPYSKGYLIRYNINGKLDMSFGTNQDGTVETVGIEPTKGDIDRDGKIVVGASIDTVIKVKRYTENGLPDRSFGNGSTAEVEVGSPYIVTDVQDIDIDRNNNILITGMIITEDEGDNCFCKSFVAKLKGDGSIDDTFNGGKPLMMDFGSFDSGIWHGVVQSDDNQEKFVAKGYIRLHNGEYTDMLVRFNENGTIDRSFGPYRSGMVLIRPKHTHTYSLLKQDDGKLIIGGDIGKYVENSNAFIARYTNDGLADRSFNRGSHISIRNFGFGYSVFRSLTFDSISGTIVAAGSVGNSDSGTSALFKMKGATAEK